MAEYVVADTSVIYRLTKTSEDSRSYQDMLGTRRLAMSFRTGTELLSFPFGARRKQRLDDLRAAILLLPHSESTDVWFFRVNERRLELKKSNRPGADLSEADVWIISSALEYSLPLMSHDIQQVHLGRAMGLKVLTNLDGLKEDNPNL